MRKTLPILIGLLLVTAVSAIATSNGSRLMPMEQAYTPGELKDEIPFNLNSGVRADTFWFGDYQTGVGPPYYARCTGPNDKAGVMWTFDRGNGPNDSTTFVPMFGRVIGKGEGWCVADASANLVQYFRVIWGSGPGALNLGNYPARQGGGPVVAPVLREAKSLWVGIDKPGADALCWTCGAGYGNDWCQEIVSENIPYDGVGTVTLSMVYFNDSEVCFDGTQVRLRNDVGQRLIMNQHTGDCPTNPAWNTNHGGWTGVIGVDSLSMPAGQPWLIVPASWTSAPFDSSTIGGHAQNINFIIQFTSDGGLSDEDCRGNFVWGPFACDNVAVAGTGVTPKSWTFETGLEGWVPSVCTPVGDYTNVVYLDTGVYEILDPCSCKLENHVLEMAAGTSPPFTHPYGQHIYLSGPICNLNAQAGMPSLKSIFMDFDMYAELPQENGVLFRPQWRYYPFLCEITSTTDWSAIVGQSAANYVGIDPECATRRYSATNLTGIPVPPQCQQVIPMIELIANCDTFAITNCTGNSNFTPLYDNLAVGVTGGVNAPYFSIQIGSRFQDTGSCPETKFDVRAPGRADVSYDIHMVATDSPDKLADSLVVVGPVGTSDSNYFWDARMWWRVAKRGAFQADTENGVTTAYKIWKDRVSDGKKIDRPYKPEFGMAFMDSIQERSTGLPVKGSYLSRFSEKDDDFLGQNSASDILPDNIFRPGTRIEYFFTSNYLGSPNTYYYLPDTTGGNFLEFEVLPGVRTAYFANCGGTGLSYCAYHPATLYIDAFNNGSQIFIENALRTILNGYTVCATPVTGCTIPYDRNWDRYDYLEASSNYKAPFARGAVAGSNNGMTLNQILGYRAILVNTGTYTSGAMEPQDFNLFDQWLVSPDCSANVNRQVYAMNGDEVGGIMNNYETYGQPFFNSTLKATLFCNSFNGVTSDADCSPVTESYCVRLQQVGVSGDYFPTIIDVDAYGNWCPQRYSFNVFSAETGGVGNRTYLAEEGGKAMSYEQVTRYNSGSSANYKTILDGVSWHHMTKRNAAGSGVGKCPTDLPNIVEGAVAELRAALRWGFDLPVNPGTDDGIPKLANVKDLATCQLTWNPPGTTDVGEDAGALRVNRLFQNEPNPFSPRTTIKFSLAQSGPVQIVIYDVNGRQVKNLVDRPMDPGSYSVIWDGTNDSNHRVGSGVYWSQMKAGSFVSNKKMVVLK